MRLNLRFQKTLAVATLAAITVSAVPTTLLASDYESHWAKVMIEKWSEKKVLEGYEDGTFKPSNEVTRGELAAILVRVFGLSEMTGGTAYTDVMQTKWYAEAVAKVSAAGIMNDYEDGTFKPEQFATREEAAYAVAKAYRIATQNEESNFTDQAQISEWAEDEIAALVAGGYLDGYPNGSFGPQDTLSRAQAVTMIHKITADLVNVAGIYSKDAQGNLVVNTTGVELKDMTITGNLYLAEGIGEGEVKLTNVTVLGDVIVEGGSTNTIKVEGESKLNNIVVDKAGKNPVRLLFGDAVEVSGTVTLESTSTLEGNKLSLKEVVAEGAKEVRLTGGIKIEKVTINETTNLALVNGPTIKLVEINKDAAGTTLSGTGTKGSIEKMTINANDVKLQEGFKYNKANITVGEGVTAPKHLDSTSTSGGGSTGGGNTGGTTEKKLHINKLVVKLAGQNTPVEISTTYNGRENTIHATVDTKANTVTINGHTFTKDVAIESITAIEKDNLRQVKVILAGLFDQVIDTNSPYDVKDIATIVNGAEHKITAMLDIFKDSLGDQYTTVKTLLTNGITDLNTYAQTNDAISVDYMVGRAERVRGELAKQEVESIYNNIKTLLNLAGISMSGVGTPTPSITYKLAVTGVQSGYETDSINMTVNYR